MPFNSCFWKSVWMYWNVCEAAGQTLVFGNKLSIQSDWPRSQGRGSSKSANTQRTHARIDKQGRKRFQTHLTATPLFCIPMCSRALKHAHVALLDTQDETFGIIMTTINSAQRQTHRTWTVQKQGNTLIWDRVCVCVYVERRERGRQNG